MLYCFFQAQVKLSNEESEGDWQSKTQVERTLLFVFSSGHHAVMYCAILLKWLRGPTHFTVTLTSICQVTMCITVNLPTTTLYLQTLGDSFKLKFFLHNQQAKKGIGRLCEANSYVQRKLTWSAGVLWLLGEGGSGDKEDWANDSGGGGGDWAGGGGAYVVVMDTLLGGAIAGPKAPNTEFGPFKPLTIVDKLLLNLKAVAFDCSGGHERYMYIPIGLTANRRLV